MQTLLDKAVEAYRRRLFLTELHNAYVALRDDPEAWAQVENDRSAWDATLNDGLEINKAEAKKGSVISGKRKKHHSNRRKVEQKTPVSSYVKRFAQLQRNAWCVAGAKFLHPL